MLGRRAKTTGIFKKLLKAKRTGLKSKQGFEVTPGYACIEIKNSRIEGYALINCSNPCSCNDITPLSILLIRGTLTTLLTKDPRYFNLHLRLF